MGRHVECDLRKLQATSQVTLDVPPHPVSETLPDLAPEPKTETATAESVSSEPFQTEPNPEEASHPEAPSEAQTAELVPAAEETRGEPRKFPNIQPPSTGDPVAAQRPFRGRITESETVTESGDAASHTAETPVAVFDEGRIGTEAQPGVIVEPASVAHNGTGQEARHG